MSTGQNLDAKLLSVLTGALQSTAPNDPPFLEDSTLALRNGTEIGLLGLHCSAHDIYATDGSLEGGRRGAGVYIVRERPTLSGGEKPRILNLPPSGKGGQLLSA